MRRAWVAAVVLAGLMVGGCGRARTPADEVRAALERTRALPRHFTYTTDAGGRKVEVDGDVEDDLRFRSTVAVDGRPVLDEVVYDDAVADRLDDPSALPLFTAPQAPDPSAAALLQSGRWVLDPSGAPSLIPAPQSRTFDPVLSALQAFDYVKAAIGEAAAVVRFNPEDVSYDAVHDPFPRPEAGVIRYDLRPPPLPRPGNSGAINQVVPDVANFRKLAVYVRAGVVVAVREKIDAVDLLQQFVHLYGAKLPAHATPEAQAAFAIDVTNHIRQAEGQQPIVLRTMTLALSGQGAAITVTLPSGAETGDLAILPGRGLKVRHSLG